MCNPDQSSAIIRMAMIDLLLVNPPNRKKDQKYVNLVVFGRLVENAPIQPYAEPLVCQ
jgi:hypothetical protein